MPSGRPDFSEYVAHFTKDAPPICEKDLDAPMAALTGATAFARLISILEHGTILATPMPWTKRRAMALTECPWGSAT
jgi:hypothetical protein